MPRASSDSINNNSSNSQHLLPLTVCQRMLMYFTHIISFNPHNSSVKNAFLLSPQKRKPRELLRNFLKFTQLVMIDLGYLTQII